MIGNEHTAQRIVNAENHFIGILKEFGDLTDAQAEVAFQTFRKLKLIKLDAVGGRYSVKHGAFMERDVIRRAAKIEE